jgi:hypothetical protein
MRSFDSQGVHDRRDADWRLLIPWVTERIVRVERLLKNGFSQILDLDVKSMGALKMATQKSTICFGCKCLFASVALGGIAAYAAPSDVVQIGGVPTGIIGEKEIISFRNQNHSWQTADGAIHLMVNQGLTGTDAGIALYSSFDGGMTWVWEFALPDTRGGATDDGVLTDTSNGATLQVVYSTSINPGTIGFATATYDTATQSWSLVSRLTAYSQSGMRPSIPAFMMDDQGNYWCAFTVEDLEQTSYQEKLIYLAAGASQWQDTGLVFSSTYNSSQHSARPVPYPGGVAMVYQDDTTLYWAYRLDGAPYTAPWTTTMLFQGLPPSSEDPYGTHYNVAADGEDNLYLAFIAYPANLIYGNYTSGTGEWQPFQELAGAETKAVYPEVTLSGGNVMLFVNDKSDVSVFQSTDGGQTFQMTQNLTHPPVVTGSGISYSQPRVESPRNAMSPVPVWEQFIDGNAYGLLFFAVPVIE